MSNSGRHGPVAIQMNGVGRAAVRVHHHGSGQRVRPTPSLCDPHFRVGHRFKVADCDVPLERHDTSDSGQLTPPTLPRLAGCDAKRTPAPQDAAVLLDRD